MLHLVAPYHWHIKFTRDKRLAVKRKEPLWLSWYKPPDPIIRLRQEPILLATHIQALIDCASKSSILWYQHCKLRLKLCLVLKLWKRELGPIQSNFRGMPSPLVDKRLSIAVTFFLRDIAKLKINWPIDQPGKWSILELRQLITLVKFPSKKIICGLCCKKWKMKNRKYGK